MATVLAFYDGSGGGRCVCDARGVVVVDVAVPKNFTSVNLKMTNDSCYDDVQNELHAIRRSARERGLIAWIALPLAFATHAVVLALIVWAIGLVFGNKTAVIAVTCAAYVSAVIGWAVYQVQQRSNQMAIHAISVHDEVLTIKELVCNEQRRSAQWKSK